MRSTYLPDGTIEISGSTSTVQFNRIWAGIGWPERDPGYLCVVGERRDGRYHALSETRGGLWELASAAVDARKSFCIERIMVDSTDELSTSYLRNYGGLCSYEEELQRASYLFLGATTHPQIKQDGPPLPTVSPVQERIITNYRAALEQTRGVIMNGKLLVHEANCPVLVYTLRQPLDEILPAPVMKALVWVINAFEQSQGGGPPDRTDFDTWYSNIERNR
jgi:hypothetical protein